MRLRIGKNGLLLDDEVDKRFAYGQAVCRRWIESRVDSEQPKIDTIRSAASSLAEQEPVTDAEIELAILAATRLPDISKALETEVGAKEALDEMLALAKKLFANPFAMGFCLEVLPAFMNGFVLGARVSHRIQKYTHDPKIPVEALALIIRRHLRPDETLRIGKTGDDVWLWCKSMAAAWRAQTGDPQLQATAAHFGGVIEKLGI